MDAMNNNTAQPVEGAGRESATNRGIPPANGVANGEAVIDQRRAQRTASAASLEERVRTETSQFDFTTLVGLGTGNGGANGGDGVSPLDRAEAIAWPMRAVQNSDPESVDGIVPEAFAPPAEPTLKLIVKTTPTPAERRRSALRTWAIATGAFVLGAAIWGLAPHVAAPGPANPPANDPAQSTLIHESARVPPATMAEKTLAPTPIRETVKPPAPHVVAPSASVVKRTSAPFRPRRARVVRTKPVANRRSSSGATSTSGFSNHVNSVLNQLP